MSDQVKTTLAPTNEELSKSIRELESHVSKVQKQLEKLRNGMDNKRFCLSGLYLILLAVLSAFVLRIQISNFQSVVLGITTVCATLFGI